MRNKNAFLLIIFMLLFSVTFVSAQPTPQQGADNFPTGFELEFTQINVLKANQTHLFNIHVLNISNGVRIDDTATECDFHLFNSSGHHVLDQISMSFNILGQDWELEALGGNFSSVGSYSYLVLCQDSTNELGGFVSVGIEVTQTGNILKVSESIIYIVEAFGVFLLFILSFYFMLATPYSNKIDEETGAVIQLTKLKYVKLGFILLVWVLLTWFLNILVGLSVNYITIPLFFGFFGFMFDLMNRLALPFGIIIIVIGLFEIIRDANLYGNLKKLGETMR